MTDSGDHFDDHRGEHELGSELTCSLGAELSTRVSKDSKEVVLEWMAAFGKFFFEDDCEVCHPIVTSPSLLTILFC